MMQSNSTDSLAGSLEGALRQPDPAQPMDADHTLPREQPAHIEAPVRAGDGAASEPQSPVVLYGRLGYIERSMIRPE